jgi:hypothetical protein
MGEARNRANGRGGTNGHSGPAVHIKNIRVVPNIRLENHNDANGTVTMLMMGEDLPELAAALKPEHSRKLAEALLAHAKQIEDGERRIYLPGE